MDLSRHTLGRRDDRGAVLPLVLVLVVVGALIVLPVLTYSVSVLRANEVQHDKNRNVEAARGGVRAALRQPGLAFGNKDRANAGCPASDADLLPPGGDVVSGVPVTIDCTPVSELSADEVFGFDVPVGAAQLQIAPGPGGFDEYSGVLASSPEAPPYPTDAGTEPWAWWQSFSWQNPEVSTDVKSIWLPDLPTLTDVERDSSPLAMPGFECQVFLPGHYADPVDIDGSGPVDNFYFASGVYYFEHPVTISGGVNVVVGQGLADFGVSNDCADDIQVGANVAVPPNTIYAIDGNSGGATWLFGDRGRLEISEAGGAPSVRFNQRYATQERGGWINIASVNGDWSWNESDAAVCDGDDDCFENSSGHHTATNVNFVPRSRVVTRDVDDTIDLVGLGQPGAPYTPSHPDLTDEARPPGAPTSVSGSAVVADGDGAIEVTLHGVEGASTRGAIVTEYEAGVQPGGGSQPPPEPTTTCTTAGGGHALVPTVEGADGTDLWGRTHPENAGDPDEYSCLITGLTVGQTYWVTARARNEAGWSDWAAPSQVPSSTWTGAPTASPADPPSGVSVQPYDDASLPSPALVSWDASTTTNGAPITGYDVQVYRVFRVPQTSTTTTTAPTTTTTPPTTTTTPPTTTTTLPPPASSDCGPPLDCLDIPVCSGGEEATAVYVSGAWQWSCEPSCGSFFGNPGVLVTTGAGTDCAYVFFGGCDSTERPVQGGFFGWTCTALRVGSNSISHGYGIPATACPAGTAPRFGYGTGYCALNGPQPFRAAGSARGLQQEPDPGTTTSSSTPTTTTTSPTSTTTSPTSTTTTVPAPVLVETEELVDAPDARCSTEPRMGRTPEDVGLEWTPPQTQCVIPNLPPLPAVDGDGFENVGYRVKATASTAVGSSPAAVTDAPFMAVTGTPGPLDELPPERAWFPYSNTSIIDIDTSGSGTTVVDIPGYVSVPMGSLAVDNLAGDEVSITGGIVAGRFDVVDSRSPKPYGYVPSVIMQRTIRLTARAGNIESDALVRINSDTSYGIVRWVTQ